MCVERHFSSFRYSVSRLRFAAHELFPHDDVLLRLQRLQMAGEVAIGQVEQFFQRVVFHPVVHRQNGHDAQPVAVVKSRIELGKQFFHGGLWLTVRGFLHFAVFRFYILLLKLRRLPCIVFPVHPKAVKNMQKPKAQCPDFQPEAGIEYAEQAEQDLQNAERLHVAESELAPIDQC